MLELNGYIDGWAGIIMINILKKFGHYFSYLSTSLILFMLVFFFETCIHDSPKHVYIGNLYQKQLWCLNL